MESLIGQKVLVTTIDGNVHSGIFVYILENRIQIKSERETVYIPKDDVLTIEPAEQLFDGIIYIEK